MQPYMIELMRYLLGVLILAFVAGAYGQAAPVPSGKSSTSSKPSPQKVQPRPDEGSVAGGVYSEKFFNLSCILPQGWVVKTASMREGLPGGQESELLLSAFAKDAPPPGEVNSSLTITTESLAAYPEVKTATEYFEALSEVVTGKGFTVLNGPAEIEIGGVTFLRGDFQKEQSDGTTYQASMVAIRNGYVLAVTAISGNEEELTSLLNRVHVLSPPSLRKQ